MIIVYDTTSWSITLESSIMLSELSIRFLENILDERQSWSSYNDIGSDISIKSLKRKT